MTTTEKPSRKPIIRSPYVKAPSKKFLFVYFGLKLVAILVGVVGTILSLMAIIGAVTDAGGAPLRLVVAVIVAVTAPVAVARLWPKRDPVIAKGIWTDVFAVGWLGFTFLFAFALSNATSSVLHAEGDRLTTAKLDPAANLAYALGGPKAASDAGVESDAAVDAPNDGHAAFVSELDAAAALLPAAPIAKGAEKTASELYPALVPSIVTITTRKATGPVGETGGGTGFLIDDAGTIATTHRVIEGAGGAEVRMTNGDSFEVVDLLVDDPANDLALLRIDLGGPADAGTDAAVRSDVRPLVLGDAETVVVGNHLFAIGNPVGLEPTLTSAVVTARRSYQGHQWFQLSVPVASGNAGAPVFDASGLVVGITTGQATSLAGQAQGLNLVIPIHVLEAMVRPTYPDRRALVATQKGR